MGLLDRWTKKVKEETLKRVAAKAVTEKTRDEDKAEIVKEAAAPTARKGAAREAPRAAAGAAGATAYRVLWRPLVTEKAAGAEALNKYSFIVDSRANKGEIKRAVEEAYGVRPVGVNVANTQGRWVRFGRRFGRRSDYKKAVVALPRGKSINLHEGV